MDKQCSSCGGFCGKYCQRENIKQEQDYGSLHDVMHQAAWDVAIPVAEGDIRALNHRIHKLEGELVCLNTVSPIKEWVGLTDEDIENCFDESCHLKVVDPKGGIKGSVNIFEVGRAIVQLCKERNT